MKAKIILNILKSMALNYPILNEWGYIFPQVIRLVVPNGRVRVAIDCLQTQSSMTLDGYYDRKNISQMLEELNSGFLFVPETSSNRTKRYIEELQECPGSGSKAVLVIVTDNEVVSVEGDYLNIQIEDEDICCSPINIQVPREEELPLIKDVLSRISLEDADECERALVASVCFLYPRFRKEKRKTIFQNHIDTVRRICEWNEERTDTKTVGNYFMEELYHCLENGQVENVFHLPNVEGSIEEVKDISIFYDEESVYISKAFFQRITEPLGSISPNMIKKSLSEEEILIHDKKTFTKKMTYCTAMGEEKRIRMMQLYKERLVIPGKMRFIDLCCEGGNHAD